MRDNGDKAIYDDQVVICFSNSDGVSRSARMPEKFDFTCFDYATIPDRDAVNKHIKDANFCVRAEGWCRYYVCATEDLADEMLRRVKTCRNENHAN